MPKLSSYVSTFLGNGSVTSLEEYPVVVPCATETATVECAPARDPQVLSVQACNETLIKEITAVYCKQQNKRIQSFGSQIFRQDDGSASSKRPANDAFSVANRRSWRAVVDYCRMHGGDKDYEQRGFSHRYNLGVAYEEHAQLMAEIGLEPEVLADGTRCGYEPNLGDEPLAVQGHIFSESAWKPAIDQVFEEAPKQWQPQAMHRWVEWLNSQAPEAKLAEAS